MSVCTAIIGAGRMGTIVASKLPAETRKIIIDTDYEKAKMLADKVAGEVSVEMDAVKEADLVAVVLPAPVVNDVLGKLADFAKDGAVIINMATNAHIDEAIKNKNKKINMLDAKIIGHAASIAKGEPGIIVVNTDNDEIFELVEGELKGFTKVMKGNSDLVEKINKVGSTEGIRTAVTVKKELAKLNVTNEEWVNVVIRTVCAGTMRSYTENDLGHFAQELVKKLENEE